MCLEFQNFFVSSWNVDFRGLLCSGRPWGWYSITVYNENFRNVSIPYMKPLAKKSNYLAKFKGSWTFARAVVKRFHRSSTPVLFSDAGWSYLSKKSKIIEKYWKLLKLGHFAWREIGKKLDFHSILGFSKGFLIRPYSHL